MPARGWGRCDAQTFSRYYQMVPSHKDVLEAYLFLEQDVGALEVSRAVAAKLAESFNIILIWPDSPRGLVDGGRWLGHSVRGVIPTSILTKLEAELELWHVKC